MPQTLQVVHNSNPHFPSQNSQMSHFVLVSDGRGAAIISSILIGELFAICYSLSNFEITSNQNGLDIGLKAKKKVSHVRRFFRKGIREND
jgi:hypothetical protein